MNIEPHDSEAPVQELIPFAAFDAVAKYANDLSGLAVELEFEYGISLERSQLRELVKHVVLEAEADDDASAPSGTDHLARETDKILKQDLKRLIKDQRDYITITQSLNEECDFELPETQEVITKDQARYRLALITDQVLAIRKALTEDVKAKSKGEGTNFNMQVNFGDAINDLNNNIKSSESVSVKQVASN